MDVKILNGFQSAAPFARAAATLLDVNLALRSGERFLLVTDGRKPAFAAALEAACGRRGLGFQHLPLAREEAFEPPAEVAAALAGVDAALLATSRSYTHTAASAAARAGGARLATSPGVDEARLIAGLTADHAAIARTAARLAERLTRAERARVTSPAGTDLSFSLAGLSGHAETGLYTHPGAIGNLPAGEASIGYAPGSARGTLVIDGSYPGLGRLDEPAVLHIEDGLAVRAEGAHAPFFESLWSRHGDAVRRLAEFGVGANPGLAIVGHSLIDEKVAGTIHVGFGNDLNFGGGNGVEYHADGTVLRPRVVADGKGVELPAGAPL